MRQVSTWIFRTVTLTGVLGFVLFVLFFILASKDASRMTTAELVVGILMVLSWLYFWGALILGIILRLLSREVSPK